MNHQELCQAAAYALDAVSLETSPSILVGFDGFLDNIIDIVDKRHSNTEYDRIGTIAEYGARISAVAGKSGNLERVLKKQKLGGNGPIMANALLGHQIDLTYIGILGAGHIEPIFHQMTDRSKKVINLGHPCTTDAYEFDDGKIMMTLSQPLEGVSYQSLIEHVGIDGLKEAFSGLDGMAMVNWTMTIEMTDIWKRLATDILPGLYDEHTKPWCFVDFCDPAKRTSEDLLEAIEALQMLDEHVNVVLGMNEEEGRQILEVLGGTWNEDLAELERAEYCAAEVRNLSKLSHVVTHFVKVAAMATPDETVAANGFFTPKPALTTGAGDNFNAGCFTAMIYGLSPITCIMLGTATSGFYVRNAHSPSRSELIDFLRNWSDD